MPAIIAPRISATQDAMSSLDDLMADNTIKLGLQKGQTAAKKAFRAALPSTLTRIHAAIVAAFGDPSKEVTECFPAGRTAFSKSTDEQLNDYLKALSTGATAHATALPAATVANAAGLLATWEALFTGLKTAKGTKRSVERTRQDLRRALAIELHINVCTLSILYPGDMDKAAYFCPTEKLDGRSTPVTPGPTTLSAGACDPQTGQVVCTMTATDADTFRLLRRVQGEPDFTVVAEDIEAVDGAGTVTDTLPAPGLYEYVAEAVNGTRTGDRSGIVQVQKT